MIVTNLQKVFEPLIITDLPLLTLLEEILSLSLIWASRGKDHAGNHSVRMEVREAMGADMGRARIRNAQFIPESIPIIWFVPISLPYFMCSRICPWPYFIHLRR